MNKVVVFFSMIVLSISLSAQVRLNEIFPASNGQNKQWIELFSYGTSISSYKLAIRYKASTTDSGFYIMSLSGVPNASNYLVVENDGNINWLNTSQVKKIRWDGVSQTLSSNESNQIFQSSGENHIFLVKNNKIVDVLVTGISGSSTPHLKAQSQINAWSLFTVQNGVGLDGFSLTFNYVQLTNLNAPNQSAGAGSSFSFIYSSQGCSTDYPWVKTSTETKGSLNSGSSVPQFDYWDVEYKISNAFAKATTDFYTVTNSRIPDASPTFDYNAGGSPSMLYLKYTIANTLITVAMDNPVLYMYYDKGGTNNQPNGVLDDTDPVVIVGVSKSIEPVNTVYLKVGISQDMFYTDGSGNRRLRPFFFVLVSQNTCFKTQDILLTEQIFPLPVTLGKFDVKPLYAGTILQWSTLAESNNAGFEVQQSTGVSNAFKKIGFVDTKAKNGNSQILLHYSFEDRDIKPGVWVYYRLKQIDQDGKSTYGPVRSIKLIEGRILNIYPNPSNGTLTIETGMLGMQQVLLMDITGHVLHRHEQSSGVSQLNGLKPGSYVLKMSNDKGEQVMRKVIVQ